MEARVVASLYRVLQESLGQLSVVGQGSWKLIDNSVILVLICYRGILQGTLFIVACSIASVRSRWKSTFLGTQTQCTESETSCHSVYCVVQTTWVCSAGPQIFCIFQEILKKLDNIWRNTGKIGLISGLYTGNCCYWGPSY
jgi:hypothetical protein